MNLRACTDKRLEIEIDLSEFQAGLRETNEQIQMTREDLMSKLMQRAELVAEREELDEIIASFRRRGQEFLTYLESGPDGFEFERFQEVSFYKGLLKNVQKMCDSDEAQDEVQRLLEEIKEREEMPVESVKFEVFSLIERLNLNVDRRKLDDKFEAYARDRLAINAK